MPSFREPDIAEKVAHLRRPDSFPDYPESVEVIETHFAWVFLSKSFVYKIKKPVRFPLFDLTTLQARRANCELEIALNRRLAAETYIGVVALGRRGSRLCLECDDDPADWLVKMHRLPAQDTLERLLPEIDVRDTRLDELIETLGTFYERTVRAPWNAEDYCRSLCDQIADCAAQLGTPALEDQQDRVSAIAESQMRFTRDNVGLLADRISQGRVRDAHGDLRPEHVFLTARPQIIDCLEFSAELRQLDTAEEISFLALECDREGRADIGERLRTLYMRRCRDEVPRRLFRYYCSRRALTRAFLSAWHLEDGLDEPTARRWLEQARWYIGAAESSIEDAAQ